MSNLNTHCLTMMKTLSLTIIFSLNHNPKYNYSSNLIYKLNTNLKNDGNIMLIIIQNIVKKLKDNYKYYKL